MYSEEEKTQLTLFTAMLNKEPNQSELQKTPDGKAWDLPISFVEMTLDELFFGMWGTQNFTTKVIANEVVGEIELFYIHPITKEKFVRVGAGCIQITVDALDEEVKNTMSKQQINMHALSPENKKPKALDMAYPKLKAECTKNAAKSIGKIFGRDLNRKKSDKFTPSIRVASKEIVSQIAARIEKGEIDAFAKAQVLFAFDELAMTYLTELSEQKRLA